MSYSILSSGWKKTAIYLFLFCLHFFFFEISVAQKRNNVWTFGNFTGLNFNTNPVTPFHSKAAVGKLPFYMTSICDKDGNLMFYTDGRTFWNRDNKVIPKYKDYWPWSADVMPLIVPYVNKDSFYYLFGVETAPDDGATRNPHKLIYFTTRMDNAGDIGEVVYPRPSNNFFATTLLTNASSVIAGTGHCNQVDTWIIAHSPGAFSAFLITEKGVSPNPVVTNIPANLLLLEPLNVGLGNFKMSANGDRLAFPNNNNNTIIVYDFDTSTGIFSNPQVFPIDELETIEDVELSADGNKLFYGSWEPAEEGDITLHYLYQLDLTGSSPFDILKSKYRINHGGNRAVCIRSCYRIYRTMQLAPDGRIYISRRDGDFGLDRNIDVINEPSKYGVEWNIMIVRST